MTHSQINPTKVGGFSKGEICWIEDYQEFGQCIVYLSKRLTKNIEGKPMRPMWECYIIANNHPDFMEFYTESSINPIHPVHIFETRLQEVSGNSSHK